MDQQYDRAAEDIGNIVALEHVNLRIPDQVAATQFFISGLGLTRDPYLVTGVTNMWVNVGRSQFHLPTGEAQRWRGRVGLVMPDLEALARRLAAARAPLAGTLFEFTVDTDWVDVTSPWGTEIRCHRPGPAFGPTALGMPYVELHVPPGAADGIARFYREFLLAPATLDETGDAPAARIAAGTGQALVFQETDVAQPAYDGHHIQIYVASFSGPHAALLRRGLISEESSRHQYRFVDIVDPTNDAPLYQLEHEVRSMTHPLYARRLVNRDPARSNTSFAHGHEDRPWAAPPEE